MKQFLKILPLVFLVPVIIIASCPVAFAAPTVYYPIASDKPTVTDYSGYVELLFEEKSSGGRFVTVLGWYYTPILNTSNDYYLYSDIPHFTLVYNNSEFKLGFSASEGLSGNISFLTVDTSSQVYFSTSVVPDDGSENFYTVTYGSDYALVGIHYYGNFDKVIDSSSYDIGTEFYVTYGSDTVISYGINQLISGMYSIIDLLDNESYKDQLDTIISNLNSIDTSIDDFKAAYQTGLTQLFSWFRFMLNDLDALVQNTDEIESKLDGLATLLTNIENWVYYIYEYTLYIYDELLTVNTKLQQILDILNVQGENGEKLTQPDNSDMDNYYDIENGLISGDTSDVGGAVDVQINQNAMSTIWDIVERAVNSNPKVFGMIITILSLGIIALILGR